MSAPVRLAAGTTFRQMVEPPPVVRQGFKDNYTATYRLPVPEQRRLGAEALASVGLYCEIESAELSTEQLITLTLMAWKAYNDSARIVAAGISHVRQRLTPRQYNRFVELIPGWKL